MEYLPNELWLSILDYLHQKSDLSNLTKTSKKLYQRTLPFLYESIVFDGSKRSGKEYTFDKDFKPFVSEISEEKIGYIKEFGVYQKQPVPRAQCITITKLVKSFLERLQDGQLRCFIWNFPGGRDEELKLYINQHQIQISSLYMNSFNVLSQKATALQFSFPYLNLKHLVLQNRGPYVSEQVTKLFSEYPILKETIESFEISNVKEDWFNGYSSSETAGNDVTTKSKPGLQIFSSLKNLKVGSNFTNHDLVNGLGLENISQCPKLEYLSLRNNDQSPNFRFLLKIDGYIPTRLKRFHIQDRPVEMVQNFLMSFKGLEDIDVQFGSDSNEISPNCFLNHSGTLKRLSIWQLAREYFGIKNLTHGAVFALGEGLPNLREFCACVPKDLDILDSGKFPGLQFLWIYNSSLLRENQDSEPSYWWYPSLELEETPRPIVNQNISLYSSYKFVPKDLCALAIGSPTRCNSVYQYGSYGVPDSRLLRLYKTKDNLVWSPIDIEELAGRMPDLLFPRIDTIPLQFVYNTTPMEQFSPSTLVRIRNLEEKPPVTTPGGE